MNRTEKGNVILTMRRAEKGNNFTNSLHTEDSPTFDSETEGQPWQKGGLYASPLQAQICCVLLV